MPEKKSPFIKYALMLTVTIIIYIVLTSTIIEYRHQNKVYEILYSTAKDWGGRQAVDQASKVTAREKAMVLEADEALSAELSGRILLQVESNGEGWYVFPDDHKKYYLGRPADAYRVMKALGLGIKSAELDAYIKNGFPDRLAGKILLDIERAGEAYYVDPKTRAGHYLGHPEDALLAMKTLGLGISNEDLRKIAVGELGN